MECKTMTPPDYLSNIQNSGEFLLKSNDRGHPLGTTLDPGTKKTLTCILPRAVK